MNRPAGNDGPRKFRIQIGIVIGLIGLLLTLYFNLFRNPKKADETKQQILEQLGDQKRQQQRVKLERKYQQLLADASVDREIERALIALRDLLSAQHRPLRVRGELRDWVHQSRLTYPDYVHVLEQSGLVDRRAEEVMGEDNQPHFVVYWRVSDFGQELLERKDLKRLRSKLHEVMSKSLETAGKYGLTVDRQLYGRYLGVGEVFESSYAKCEDWMVEDEDKVESRGDNRIFGKIEVYVLAGMMWWGHPYREEEILVLESKPSNDIGIRGCPKVGDLVGFVWRPPYNPMWEKLYTPPHKKELVD